MDVYGLLVMTPYLARIDLYPIKSFDGVSVTQATLLPSGALAGDRTYALHDDQGRFINGKRNAAIHRVRSRFSSDLTTVTLSTQPETGETFHLQQDRPQLEAWLSDYFQQPVKLQANQEMGFPDDTTSPGPTIISTATLAEIAAWYPDLTPAEVRRRFRANLEIDGVPAFWEDHLFAAEGQPVRFQIGEVILQGINPCQRCIVPTRDSLTGDATDRFQKIFSENREATLPEGVVRSRFNHFYRLAVNTRRAEESGDLLRVGDPLQRLD